MSETKIKRTAQHIQQFYNGDTEPDMLDLRPFVDLATDRGFWQPTVRIIRMREMHQAGCGANYLYRFCFDSKLAGFAIMKMLICNERVKGTMEQSVGFL